MGPSERPRATGAVDPTVQGQWEGKGGDHFFLYQEFYIKKMFGPNKVGYRSLVKNENRPALLPGFANVLPAQFCMV